MYRIKIEIIILHVCYSISNFNFSFSKHEIVPRNVLLFWFHEENIVTKNISNNS